MIAFYKTNLNFPAQGKYLERNYNLLSFPVVRQLSIVAFSLWWVRRKKPIIATTPKASAFSSPFQENLVDK